VIYTSPVSTDNILSRLFVIMDESDETQTQSIQVRIELNRHGDKKVNKPFLVISCILFTFSSGNDYNSNHFLCLHMLNPDPLYDSSLGLGIVHE